MPIRQATHLYRNRHGVFYYRLKIPLRLLPTVTTTDVRLSLKTDHRPEAIIHALHMTADVPRVMRELQRMANNNEQAPPDYFTEWRDQLYKNVALKAKVNLLQDEVDALNERLGGMVPTARASRVAKIMYDKGQLHGKQELEGSLLFPWPPEKTRPFSELGKAYLASFNHRLEKGRKKPPSEKAREKYLKDIELFVTVMGDVKIGSIDRDVAGEYFKLLKRLPANMNKSPRFKGKSITQVLAMKPEPQSEVTISGKLGTLSTMYKWALDDKRAWGIDTNPFSGFALAEKEENRRRPFTQDELLALLKHPTFISRRFNTTYGYWLIPLALFTGARLGELCQLDLKDFVVVDGIHCIDINDTEATVVDPDEKHRAKRLKTKNARRLVPIHPALIELGLLRYVDSLLKKKQIYLFPELSRIRRDGPAQAASNWFQKYRARVGLTEKQTTVFHSFRHLFITALLDSGVPPHSVAPIVGHERDLITGQVYWNVRDATKRKPTVDAFSLAADVLALIPKVEAVWFPQGSKSTRKLAAS